MTSRGDRRFHSGTSSGRPRAGILEVAVVGGGASAVCLLHALADLDTPGGRITVFDPGPEGRWSGRAYDEDLDVARVNAFPEDMTVRAADTGHYARWIERYGADVAPDPGNGVRFAPRALYGRYLADSAQEAQDRLRARGWVVSRVRAQVVAARRTAGRVVLRTTASRHHAFDYAVLCVGMGDPADPYQLSGSPGFVADPYPLEETLLGIDPDVPVGVLGSGLTAIDVVLGLLDRGHQGPITLASRAGALPAVRQTPRHDPMTFFVPLRFRVWAKEGRRVPLSRVLDLMRQELDAAGASPARLAEEIRAVEGEPAEARLRRQLAEVGDPDPGLRILQQAVPECGPDVWPLLPSHERDAFLAEHYRTLMSLCCPMPPSTAATLLGAVDRGAVRLAGGLRDVRAGSEGFTLHFGAREERYAAVINAVSPPGHRIPTGARCLVKSLLEAGAAQRHRHGGLALEPSTSRLLGPEGPDPRLYALGGLGAGSLLFTFGIPSLVDRAVDIAQALAEHVQAAPLHSWRTARPA